MRFENLISFVCICEHSISFYNHAPNHGNYRRQQFKSPNVSLRPSFQNILPCGYNRNLNVYVFLANS